MRAALQRHCWTWKRGGPHHSALCVSRRRFYAGLDDRRVQRLRRSGMTFNRPRGRDLLSQAFESRLQVVPLNSIADLYRPVEASLVAAAQRRSPIGSEGSQLERRKALEGDARMQQIQAAKQKAEAEVWRKTSWRVLVVDPIRVDMVGAAVPYPSAHPLLYADWPLDPLHLQSLSSTMLQDSESTHRQRLPHHPSLEYTAEWVTESASDSLHSDSEASDTSASSAAVRSDSPSHGSPPRRSGYFYPSDNRRHLQQNGDTTLLRGKVVRKATLHLPPDAPPSSAAAEQSISIQQYFYTALCIDPVIDVARFHREEAQVEMISAYRNIFYEAAELCSFTNSSTSSGSLRHLLQGDSSSSSSSSSGEGGVADIIRIPALSCYSCGPRFSHEIAKLNQQAVIKGFHRLSNEAKEVLVMNRSFSVELFVPPLLLEQFETTFLEEPWEVPVSSMNPGRTALYPGLAPPSSLLQYDGWVGKRPELFEAVHTKGASLLRGPKLNLDGSVVEEQEVFSQLRLFGAEKEQAARLQGERHTAAAELGSPLHEEVAPLQPGLQVDAAQEMTSMPLRGQ